MTFYRGTSDKTWEESQTTLNISPFEVGSDTHSGSILQQSQPQQHSTSLIDPGLTLSSSRTTPLQSVAQASEQSLEKEIEKLAVATTYRDQRTSNGPARIERVVANQGVNIFTLSTQRRSKKQSRTTQPYMTGKDCIGNLRRSGKEETIWNRSLLVTILVAI